MAQRQEVRRIEVQRQFGLGREPMSVEVHGHRLVAVGPELHWSSTWKTFPDFLLSYFKTVMGREWGEAQLAKDKDLRHPIFSWYAMTCDEQRRQITTPGKVISTPVTGAIAGVLWLTYGLYLLRHNAEIQGRLLQRLRTDDPVQVFGAIYEVFIAGAFIWSGFELELENESDGSETHCEFVATSKITGKKYSVEVKVCDPGKQEATRGRNRVVRQLARSLGKEAKHTRVVCIDLNKPTSENFCSEELERALLDEARRIRRQEAGLRIHGKPAPPAYMLLTSFPFRFHLGGTNVNRSAILEGFKIPRLRFDALFYSLREFGDFREKHADAFRLLNAMREMQIPSTLDGDLPSRAFGKPGQSLRVGGRYLVEDADGSEVVGELTSAVVQEQSMRVAAVLRLSDGRTILAETSISQEELAVYRESSDTFFGVYEPKPRIEEPIELYEWLLSVYRQTAAERLLEFMSQHADIESLRGLPQLELAKTYAERMTLGALKSRGRTPPLEKAPESDGDSMKLSDGEAPND